MTEWNGTSIYGKELSTYRWGSDGIALDVGKHDAILSVDTAKSLRKALKKIIKEIEGR